MRRHSVFSHAVRAHSARDSWLNFLIKNQYQTIDADRSFSTSDSIRTGRFPFSGRCIQPAPFLNGDFSDWQQYFSQKRITKNWASFCCITLLKNGQKKNTCPQTDAWNTQFLRVIQLNNTQPSKDSAIQCKNFLFRSEIAPPDTTN